MSITARPTRLAQGSDPQAITVEEAGEASRREREAKLRRSRPRSAPKAKAEPKAKSAGCAAKKATTTKAKSKVDPTDDSDPLPKAAPKAKALRRRSEGKPSLDLGHLFATFEEVFPPSLERVEAIQRGGLLFSCSGDSSKTVGSTIGRAVKALNNAFGLLRSAQ